MRLFLATNWQDILRGTESPAPRRHARRRVFAVSLLQLALLRIRSTGFAAAPAAGVAGDVAAAGDAAVAEDAGAVAAFSRAARRVLSGDSAAASGLIAFGDQCRSFLADPQLSAQPHQAIFRIQAFQISLSDFRCQRAQGGAQAPRSGASSASQI